MPELAGLGREVSCVVRIVACFERNPVDNLEAELRQRVHLDRIVGHQAQPLNVQMRKHRFAHAVVAQVRIEPEPLVRFDRVGTLVLQLIRPDFVDQANPPTFLPQIQHNAGALGRDPFERALELCTAIAAHGEEAVARQTFRVNAAQHRRFCLHVAKDDREVLLTRLGVLEAMQLEHAKRRGKIAGIDKND